MEVEQVDVWPTDKPKRDGFAFILIRDLFSGTWRAGYKALATELNSFMTG